MERPQISDQVRSAFHQAGHAVVAFGHGIDLQQISISPDNESDLCFSPLREVCGMRRLPSRHVRERVQRIATFVLAGCAAELIRVEQHYGIDNGSGEQEAFRREWESRLFEEHWADFDYVYQMVSARLHADDTAGVERRMTRLWNITCELMYDGPIWAKVEAVAHRLQETGTMTAQDIAVAVRD